MTEDRLKKQIEDILRENNGIYGTTDRIFAACREHFAGLAAARREVAGVGGGAPQARSPLERRVMHRD